MSRREGRRISLILALVFPAVVGAALALSYYGYRYAESLSRRSEALLIEGNREAADRLIHEIERRIDVAVYGLFQALRIDDVATLGAAPPEPEETPPIIESFVILDQRRRVQVTYPRSAARGKKAVDDKWQKYGKELLWSSVTPWTPEKEGNFRYLHQLFDGKSVLLAYARKKTLTGDDYDLAAKIDLRVVADWLPGEVAILGSSRRIVVRDEQARAVFPQSAPDLPPSDGGFLHESSFGKALYGWRIQLAPMDVEELQTEARRQQILGRLLVPFSTVIVAVGLSVLLLAVRAERRASRLKSEFIANVSHELKTPLSLIRMFGELIATGRHKGEETARDYAGIITRESDRLSHLIDNVLDFARLERGKASYDFAEGHMAEVVERTLDVCRYRLEKEKLKLLVDIDSEIPSVRMDENAMTLLLLNLVDNAVKYGAEGGEVEVKLGRSPGGVVLTVRDRGPGIAPADQGRIFERLYRARNARDRNVRGSGIGLSLVKHIAEAHGGRVEVESGAGRGATFLVFVPAAPRTREEEAAARGEDGRDGQSRQPRDAEGDAAGVGGSLRGAVEP